MGEWKIRGLWRRLTGGRVQRVELNQAEMAELIDRQTRQLLDMNAESFLMLLNQGELDRKDWRVEYLAGLVK